MNDTSETRIIGMEEGVVIKLGPKMVVFDCSANGISILSVTNKRGCESGKYVVFVGQSGMHVNQIHVGKYNCYGLCALLRPTR
jgi:hypothetical protein